MAWPEPGRTGIAMLGSRPFLQPYPQQSLDFLFRSGRVLIADLLANNLKAELGQIKGLFDPFSERRGGAIHGSYFIIARAAGGR